MQQPATEHPVDATTADAAATNDPAAGAVSAPIDDAPADLATGLTAAEVERHRAEHGTNELPSTTSRSLWAILRANVFTLFNLIVLACFTLLAVLGRWQDAIFGFSAIANSVIGVWQEYSAKRQLDNLRVLHAPHARALRDGEIVDLLREELVIGDVIQVRAGDQVPADARVLGASGLQVDESLLTGEEDAVDKRRDDELLSGAIVVHGHGTALVHRVGAESFAAKLTAEAKRFSLVNSEIRDGINKVLRILAVLLVPVMLIAVNGQINAFGGYELAFIDDSWRDAAVGAVAAVALVQVVAGARGGGGATLLLVGIALNAFLGAVISVAIANAPTSDDAMQAVFWLNGDLTAANWRDVGLAVAPIVIGLAVLLAAVPELNLFLLGDEQAATTGVRTVRTRQVLLALAALVTAAGVAVTGIIAFVGLVVPHLVRLVLGPDHRILLPVSMAVGAIFLALADLVARNLLDPVVLQTGTVTAFIGAPVLLVLVLRRAAR